MIRLIRFAIVKTLIATLPFFDCDAQSAQPLSNDALSARIDSIAQAYMAAKGPASMSVVVTRGNDTLLVRAWGVADAAANRAATPATVYRIGSVSKQFTAALILKQVDRGKLGLTDPIGQHLTAGLRPEWRQLTVEQLMNHTSGLPVDLQRGGRNQDPAPVDSMIAWAARDTVLFARGTKFAYSNVGYLLLGALVEKLYGKPYSEALREEIARPLGLGTLAWCTPPENNPAMARGYTYYEPRDFDDPAQYGHPSKSLGGGALCSSAGDLAAWNRALHGGKVLSRASYTAMITPRAPSSRYGLGLYVQPTPWGETAIFHTGGIMGFAAQNVWLPAKSISVTALFNSAGNGFPSPVALDIARAVSEATQY